jgi:hypothetical protein
MRKGEQDNSFVCSRTQEVVGVVEAEGFLGFFQRLLLIFEKRAAIAARS